MAKLKIGFVGVGFMGQAAHLKNFASLPDCEVVALAELRPKLGKLVAARYDVPRVYANHRELLKTEKLDGIVAIQPFGLHGRLLPELLEAKVPLLTEKPLAINTAAGERVLKALKASGTWHMVGYNKRSDPASMYVKAEVDQLKATKDLGALRYVRITMPPGSWIAGGAPGIIDSGEPVLKLENDPPPDDMDAGLYGEYVRFINYFVHQVNFMRFMFGEPYEVTHADPSGVMMVVKSSSGVPGVIEMEPYKTSVGWQESVLVTFEKGWIRLDLPPPMAFARAGEVTIMRDPEKGKTPETIQPAMPNVHSMLQQAENFLKCIRGEMKPPCDAAEALEDLKVARQYIRLYRGK